MENEGETCYLSTCLHILLRVLHLSKMKDYQLFQSDIFVTCLSSMTKTEKTINLGIFSVLFLEYFKNETPDSNKVFITLVQHFSRFLNFRSFELRAFESKKCSHCNKLNDNLPGFYQFPLNIELPQPDSSYSLDDLVKALSDQKIKYNCLCDWCYFPIYVNLNFKYFPDNLVITIDRRLSSREGKEMKNKSSINFQVDGWKVKGINHIYNYNLYALTCHEGESIYSGKYSLNIYLLFFLPFSKAITIQLFTKREFGIKSAVQSSLIWVEI